MSTDTDASGSEQPADSDVLDAIESELQERHTKRMEGEYQSADEQAITSSELAETITGETAEANPRTREAMKILMRERGLPIVGDHRGNWIPVTDGPVEAKLDDLDARIAGIEERKQLLAQNWGRWNSDTGESEPEPPSIPQAVRECVMDGTTDRAAVVETVADVTGRDADAVDERLNEFRQEGFIYEVDGEVRLP